MSDTRNDFIASAPKRKPFAWRQAFMSTYFLYAVSLFVIFLAWDRLAASGILGSTLASPHEVAVQFRKMLSGMKYSGIPLWGHVLDSLQRVTLGFLIAAMIGVPLGLIMALVPTVDTLMKPAFNFFKPMPPIAWISISVLWFGIGETSKVFIIAIGSFVPCLLNAYGGIILIEREQYDVIRNFGGARIHEIRHVCLPAAIPAIFAGLQIGLSSAWTCVLAAELLNSRTGIGFLIKRGMDSQQTALIIGGMFLIALFARLSSLLIDLAERKLCPWREL